LASTPSVLSLKFASEKYVILSDQSEAQGVEGPAVPVSELCKELLRQDTRSRTSPIAS
jgi:hypothetical protein